MFLGGRSSRSEIADDIARGFGNLTGQSKAVTREGIDAIIDHLTNSPYLDNAMGEDFNIAMVRRLESALADGRQISGADLSFYLHEQAEAVRMARLTSDNPTMGELLETSGYKIEDLVPYASDRELYNVASLGPVTISDLPSDLRKMIVYQYSHQAALDIYGVSHFSLYPEEVGMISGAINTPYYQKFWQEFPSGN